MIYGIDIYHGDVLESDIKRNNISIEDCFKKVATNAAFVIHKATQGLNTNDPLYAERRKPVEDAELLWGAYHFNTGDNVQNQVDHFFNAAKPDANTLMALDFEDNKQSQMNLDEAVEFLSIGDKLLGRKLKIYSGNRIKALIINTDPAIRNFLAAHDLWGCEYGPEWKNIDVNQRPLPWDKPFIWQFTGDGVGPYPHTIPGVVTKGIDINRFEGTSNELKAKWID